jgi:hypothetical protein
MGASASSLRTISPSHTLKCTLHRKLHASSSAATCEVVRLWQSGLMPLHSLRLGAGVSHLPLFERWCTKCLIEYESLFHLWLIWQCERLDGLRLWTAGGTTNSLIFSQLCFTCQYRAKFETKRRKQNSHQASEPYCCSHPDPCKSQPAPRYFGTGRSSN